MSRAFTFEFEDVIAECDEHVRVESTRVPTTALDRKLWRAIRAAELYLDRRTGTGGDELVFAVAQVLGDLPDHLAFQSTLRSAATSAAFVEELWLRELPLQYDMRRFLSGFDHVFVSCAGTVAPLAEHLDTPVTYLPPSVDHDRFAANPWPPSSIDVYAMGRRQPRLHEALLRWVESDRSRFYLYDTFDGNPPVVDHRQHRDKLADLIRRSRVFVVNSAKVDRPGETRSQTEAGYRFFEGAAAGALMVGTGVSSPVLRDLFDWDEPFIEVDPSGEDIVDKIVELEGQPERSVEIRRRNARGSLLAHDPAHRWRAVLRTLDLEEPAGVGRRIERLRTRAGEVNIALETAGGTVGTAGGTVGGLDTRSQPRGRNPCDAPE
jgi:hypothetical protein